MMNDYQYHESLDSSVIINCSGGNELCAKVESVDIMKMIKSLLQRSLVSMTIVASLALYYYEGRLLSLQKGDLDFAVRGGLGCFKD
jgi:hypothetical protein